MVNSNQFVFLYSYLGEYEEKKNVKEHTNLNLSADRQARIYMNVIVSLRGGRFASTNEAIPFFDSPKAGIATQSLFFQKAIVRNDTANTDVILQFKYAKKKWLCQAIIVVSRVRCG